MHKKSVIQTAGLALAGLFVATAASAVEPQVPVPSGAAVTVHGVQVAIDPATGRLVTPTTAQSQALARAMLQRQARPATPGAALRQGAVPRNEAEALATFRTIQLKHGRKAVGMALPENLMSNLVAERRADGSLSIHHEGDGQSAAAQEVSQ